LASIRSPRPIAEVALKISLLGPLRIVRDGRVLDLQSKKAQALLGYLALPPGRRHARVHLATLLWGGMGDEQARHNLRQCLSVLRRALGDRAVVGEGDRIYLDADVVHVDVATLDRTDGESATGVVDGELLEGLSVGEEAFDDWLADERARLRALVCDRLGRLAAARAAAGGVDDAIETARRLLALDPANEEAHRLLMGLYARAGRRSAAVRQYEACVAALERHLRIGPGAETIQLRNELRRPGPADSVPDAPSPPRERASLVVLPFANAGRDVREEYFGIGIAEEITSALGRFGALFVISALTTYTLRGPDVDPRRVATDLGVQYVVHGSIRRDGKRLRLTVNLVDGSTATHVWGRRYDRELSDVFAVQDDVVGMVVATLVSRVEAAAVARMRRAPTESLAAYDCFLRGREYHHRWTLEDNTRAIEMLERAIALDPVFALAHAWLACAFFSRTFFESDPTLVTRCWDAIQRAYALDDGESEVHRMLSAFHLQWKELDKADFHAERALALNPNNDRMVCQMGELATYSGRPGEGERWLDRALRLNPQHPVPRYWLRLAQALYHQGRFDEALTAVRREPLPVPHQLTYLAAILVRLGRRDEAAAVVQRIWAADPHADVQALVRPLPYRRAEDVEQVAQALRLAGLPG
jgi:TolB-like protein/tetratricopeptide (TPR) repeat protein